MNLNCSCSLCEWLQSAAVVMLLTHSFFIPFVLVSFSCWELRMLPLCPRDSYRRGMMLFLHAGAAAAASLLMKLGTGERQGGEERCFEEPALKMKPFEGCLW